MKYNYPVMLEYIYSSKSDPRKLIVEFTNAKTGTVIISESGRKGIAPNFTVGETKDTWVNAEKDTRWKLYQPTFKIYKIKEYNDSN